MNSQPPGIVIITRADSPTGLTTARALRGLDIQCWGLVTDRRAYAARSRYWSKILTVPGDPDAQLSDLMEHLGRLELPRRPLLLCSDDAMVMAASARQGELEASLRLVLPDHDATMLLMDKTRFHAWATRNRIPVPPSVIVADELELATAGEQVSFPLVLKPLVRTGAWDEIHPRSKFFFIPDSETFEEILGMPGLFDLSPRFLVQEWVPGDDHDVYFYLFSVSRSGEFLAEVGGRKLWQWPIRSGSTAVCIPWEDSRAHALAQEIVQRAGLRGLGSIEFKRHRESGDFLVVEPTVGRNDHQSGLAMLSGANPTAQLVAAEFGLIPPRKPRVTYRKACWIDELATFRRMRRHGVRWWEVRTAMLALPGTRIGGLISDVRDPHPAWSMWLSLMAKRLSRNRE